MALIGSWYGISTEVSAHDATEKGKFLQWNRRASVPAARTDSLKRIEPTEPIPGDKASR